MPGGEQGSEWGEEVLNTACAIGNISTMGHGSRALGPTGWYRGPAEATLQIVELSWGLIH